MPYQPYIATNADKFVWLITFISFASNFLFEAGDMGSPIALICTLLILVSTNFKFEVQVFHLMILQFTLFCYATAFWAMGYGYAIEKGNQLFFIFCQTSILYSYYKTLPSVDKLLEIAMYGGYFVVFLAFSVFGTGRFINLGEGSARLGGFGNANTLGMMAATTIVINLYYFMMKKHRKLFFLAIPAIMVIAASQSRKAIFILVVGTITLYFLKNIRGRKDNLIPVMKFFFFLAAGIGLFVFLSKTGMFSGAMHRIDGLIASFTNEGDVDSSTSKREFMREIGWIQFSRTPLLGIGMGCARILAGKAMDLDCYLHCNYAELAADGGIIGLISYYVIFIYALIKEMKFFKVDTMASLIITLIIIRLTTDWGAVTYYKKTTYFYVMIYYLHILYCQQKYKFVKKPK